MAPNFDLKNKVIVITGGSGGIGLATAELLLAEGAKVSIADASEKGLAEAAAKIKAANYPGQVMTQQVDVRDGAQVDAWIAATVAAFGKLDGAVNLAGVIPKVINIERVEELNEPDWQFVMDVNLTGVMHSMRAQIPNMNDKGSIINAASLAGYRGFAKNAAYTATKHGVVGLTRSAAKEVGDRGIRVNAICPGIIDTAMHRESNRLRGKDIEPKFIINRKGQPEEVAALCAWLLCDWSQYITGALQVIDGGYTL